MTKALKNLQRIQDDMAQVQTNDGIEGNNPTLLVASKTQDIGTIRPLIDAGHMLFGENRVQEAQEKWTDIKENHPDLKLHLIGPLQSNKAKDAVELFDVIETIDRPKIAQAIKSECDKQNKHPDLYIQVNTGDEEQKSGISPADFDSFYCYCTNELGLKITGLMCIPTVDEAPGLHFALLSDLAAKYNIPQLSMGMSHDYETAIRFGSTQIRIGTDIFGKRS